MCLKHGLEVDLLTNQCDACKRKARVWKKQRLWWAEARLSSTDPLSRYRWGFTTWGQAIQWALKPWAV